MTQENLIGERGFLAGADISAVHTDGIDLPTVRRIGLGDLRDSLEGGVSDFRANPTHLIFLCVIYPVVGLLLGRIASGQDALPLIYPLLAGFALVGPFTGVGLYNLSRQREMTGTISWRSAFDVLRSPRIGAILMLGAMLAVLFVLWLMVAQRIFHSLMPASAGQSITELVTASLTTPAGWTLILVGTLVGACFAVAALTLTVVSFPLLVDREAGRTTGEQVSIAVRTSIRAVAKNPLPMAVWGLTVAIGLALGMAFVFVGLAVVIPIFGHATWHLYRRVVV
jgi:uncharacterized membrane protein